MILSSQSLNSMVALEEKGSLSPSQSNFAGIKDSNEMLREKRVQEGRFGMEDEEANPTPQFSKFAGLISSPDLLRERKQKDAKKEGKKVTCTQQIGFEKLKKEAAFWVPLNDSVTNDVKGEEVQGKEISAKSNDMAAIISTIESMQGTNHVLSQRNDLAEFPVLSRESLALGTKAKPARPAMAVSLVQDTRREGHKATNPLDCPPFGHASGDPESERLTQPGDMTESIILGDDRVELEKDFHSKCGDNANKVAAPNSQDFSSSFVASKRTTLRYVKPELVHGNVFVRPTWDIVQQGKKRWDNTAVGYFIGKKPSFMGVRSYVNSIWKGIVEVKATSSGFYFFKFDCEERLLHVLEGGPWMYAGQPLFLERWKEGMTLEHKPHQEVPIWIKFRNLPTEYWTNDGLSTIASSIGTPLYPDAFTSTMERIDYARVCVLVSVNAKFHDHIYIMLPSENGDYNGTCKVVVEYEWRPLMCTKCHSFGHGTTGCPLLKKAVQQSKLVQVYIPKPRLDEEWQQPMNGKGASKSKVDVGEKSLDKAAILGAEVSKVPIISVGERGKKKTSPMIKGAKSPRAKSHTGRMPMANHNPFSLLADEETIEKNDNDALPSDLMHPPFHEDAPTHVEID